VAGAAAVLAASLAACGSGSGDGGSTTTAGGSSAGTPDYSVGAAGITLSKSANPVKIVWVGNGGEAQDLEKKTIQEPFSKITGDSFANISPQSQPQVKAMESSGHVIWDVVNIGSNFTNANCGKLFAKIDTSLYANLDKYPAGSVTPCMVPNFKYANIFSYNTKKFANNPPTSIKDFFDTKKYPGKRLVYDAPNNGLYEAALVASGVAPDKLYPLDIARAQKEMNKIKGDLILSPTYGAAQQSLATDQAAMTIMVTTRTQLAIEDGAHLAPVWDFTSYAASGFSILKNAPHEKEAQKLVAFISTKKISIDYASANGFAPANPAIQPSEIPFTALQKKYNAFQGDRGTVQLEDPDWYAKNYAQLTNSYTKWKVS
jgi:putative spermidine/putrescine transport system substrate-binding protein